LSEKREAKFYAHIQSRQVLRGAKDIKQGIALEEVSPTAKIFEEIGQAFESPKELCTTSFWKHYDP